MLNSAEIARSILESRKAIIRAWLTGPQGDELLRLERAFSVLTGESPPSISEVAAELSEKAAMAPYHIPPEVADFELSTRVSVKDAVRDLVGSSPQVWTLDALESALEFRPGIGVKNLRASIRSALHHLANEGVVENVDRGEYRVVADMIEVTDSVEAEVSKPDGEPDNQSGVAGGLGKARWQGSA
jgi:hypothetical protein